MFENRKEPKVLVEKLGLEQISDEDAILEIVRKVVEHNPKPIQDLRTGKDIVTGFLVGQAMKASKTRKIHRI